MTKNFDPYNFPSLTITTKPHHCHWQNTLPFLLSSWQHFARILPLSQWLWRKSTTWFLSRRMRRHFWSVKPRQRNFQSALAQCSVSHFLSSSTKSSSWFLRSLMLNFYRMILFLHVSRSKWGGILPKNSSQATLTETQRYLDRDLLLEKPKKASKIAG